LGAEFSAALREAGFGATLGTILCAAGFGESIFSSPGHSMSYDDLIEPNCPKCGKMMHLARVIPSIFDQKSGPITRTFECQSCGTMVTAQTRPER
jgi:hypothetical protein